MDERGRLISGDGGCGGGLPWRLCGLTISPIIGLRQSYSVFVDFSAKRKEGETNLAGRTSPRLWRTVFSEKTRLASSRCMAGLGSMLSVATAPRSVAGGAPGVHRAQDEELRRETKQFPVRT